MASYAELVAAEAAIRDILAGGAEAELRAIPGVTHVSVGLKERAGAVTRQGAIRVYVRDKRPADRVPAAERVPPEIGGVPTDVNVVQAYRFSSNFARYRPIKGGIQVSNRILDVNDDETGTELGLGTLACIATDLADQSAVLLSNWHVLMANSARTGDRIYQPAPSTVPPADLGDLPLRPRDDVDAVAKIVRSAITDKVDGAIARIDVSSCCRCCGIDYRNEIDCLRGEHPRSSFVVGHHPAVMGMRVYKVGQQTGRTVGHVVDPSFGSFDITAHGSTHTFTGQIQIASDDPARPFSLRGDSGALLVDDDNFAVGLLFANNRDAPPDARSIANHIADVCAALNIRLNFTDPSHPSAGARVSVPARLADVDVEPSAAAYRFARERLRADPAGRWLLETAEAHREEVVHLVTHCRPVTVAWHRARGPVVFASALAILRAGDDELPAPGEGVSLHALLERMGAALAARGSAALREAIETHGPALLEAVRGSATLAQCLEKLAPSVLAGA